MCQSHLCGYFDSKCKAKELGFSATVFVCAKSGEGT